MTNTITKANDLMASMMERENAIVEALNENIREYNVLAKKALSAFNDMKNCEDITLYAKFSRVFDRKMKNAHLVAHTIESFAKALGYNLDVVDKTVPFWGVQFKEIA